MRAERLLSLVQILRRSRKAVTAAALAEELEVTERTIYRDVEALRRTSTPIRGERGIGYLLDSGYDLPPLMFNGDELEALMLGARMVMSRADNLTARAAKDAISKIASAIPKEHRAWLVDTPLYAPNFNRRIKDRIELGDLRVALRQERVLSISYESARGEVTERCIWPLSLAFFEDTRGVVAWCELRNGFRHFRTDRILAIELLERKYSPARKTLLRRWAKSEEISLSD